MADHLKDISEWDLDFVLGLSGEFDWIDFKESRWFEASPAGFDKMSPYLSAFANYGGGYLVIGVKDPRTGENLQADAGVLIDLKGGVKSWLENVLPNLTDPPLRKLNVHLITDPQGNAPASERAIVVIHIPQSEEAPHQARDHRYYTRVGTKLAAVGHQAVTDIINRRKSPSVRTDVFINFHPQGGKNILRWIITNLSDVFVRYTTTVLQVPTRIDGRGIKFDGLNLLALDDGNIVWEFSASNHDGSPLFPRGSLKADFEFEVVYTPPLAPTIEVVKFVTFADQMFPVKGELELASIVNVLRYPRSKEVDI